MKKRYYYGLTVVVLGCVVSVFILGFKVHRHPSIYFPEGRNHDFGKINEEKEVVISIPVENRGRAPLEIKNIKTGCGCTTAVCEQPTLQAGDRSRIKVTYRPYDGPGDKVTTQIWCDTNDPRNPVAGLVLTGTVERAVSVRPQSISFYYERGTASKNQYVQLKTDRPQPLRIERIETSSNKIIASREPDMKNIVCRISFDPNSPAGIWQEEVKLSVSVGEFKKTVLIPVHLMIQ